MCSKIEYSHDQASLVGQLSELLISCCVIPKKATFPDLKSA